PDRKYFGPDYVPSVRWLAQRATIIANSRSSAGRLLEVGVPANRMVIKYLGVPVPEFPPKRNKGTSGVDILYLGRLIDCKGPDLVIRAFELACDRGMDARLTVAGDGELRKSCELLRRKSRYVSRITLL